MMYLIVDSICRRIVIHDGTENVWVDFAFSVLGILTLLNLCCELGSSWSGREGVVLK